MKNFHNGVNLGGWISQYKAYDHEHFRSFITEDDIVQIADWGFDHVRLPVDYPVLESDDAPSEYLVSGFAYIDACLDWCRTNGLGLVLDLHHAPGYSFTNTLKPETQHLNVLFTQDAAQDRFISLWEAIANRYRDPGIPIIFELLNEVVLPNSAPWNTLARLTVAAIREIAPEALIMIGGNNYNSVSELINIDLFDDPGVCYTFHFYEPFLFTHQKARWVKATVEYDQTLEYPGPLKNLEGFLERNPGYREAYGWQLDRSLDRTLMLEFLQPAFDFLSQTGRELYCGEFGVIETAPQSSARRWHTDLLQILDEYGIGRAVWTYKAIDFGLVDAQGEVQDSELVKILSQS